MLVEVCFAISKRGADRRSPIRFQNERFREGGGYSKA